MEERKHPESTRCTCITSSQDRQLFHFAGPGDRVEIYEETIDGRPTGYFLVAKVMRIGRIAPSGVTPIPRSDPGDSSRPDHP